MSATGRNREGRERVSGDVYETPGWCVRGIAHYLWTPGLLSGGGGVVLDPCAGSGGVLREALAFDPWVKVKGFEVDPAIDRPPFGEWIVRDALAEGSWGRPALILTNPPYALAEAFIDRALSEVWEGGTVAMLLRLNYLGSQKRAEFHREHPSDVFVLSRRPSFRHGGTDATEYAWFVWGAGRGSRWEIL